MSYETLDVEAFISSIEADDDAFDYVSAQDDDSIDNLSATDVARATVCAEVEDVMSFDASDLLPAAAASFQASDDDLLELWFSTQVEPPKAVRARRLRAAAANEAQMRLFA